MAKKNTQSKMTFQFWVEQYDIKPPVAEGVKVTKGITNTSRMTEDEFKSMVDEWLSAPVKGESNG